MTSENTTDTNDYALEPVPESAQTSGVAVGMINGALAFTVPGLITGIEIGEALGFWESIAAFLVGGLILAFFGTVTALVGRAVPEITHSTYYLNGLDAAPVIAANSFCETFVCEGLHDDQRAEHVMRALCQVSANDIAAIDHAMPVKDIRHALIGGTISKAWALGKAVSAAKEEGADIAKVIADVGNGFVAFRGKVTAFEFDTIGGFSVGSVDLAGADDDEGNDAGHTYQIGVKNENLVSYHDGEVDVTIPDLICVIDENTGDPVTNPHYEIGQSLVVIILPAPDAFLYPKGLATFGPAYVGVDAPYRPASLQNRHNK